MPQAIGIIGCSAEGASLCYRTICAEGAALLADAHAHPEVVMHTHSLGDYTACLERRDLAGVGDLMLSSAHKLAAAGADFVICPDNTIHQALPIIEARLPLPMLHIADVVADQARAQGLSRVGLTGTAWLMASDVYPTRLARHGIECVIPAPSDRTELHRIIMDELVRGVFRDESTAAVLAIIHRLAAQDCQAVILGCTELPLIVTGADGNGLAPIATLDSTRLLARTALRRACHAPA